MAAILSEALSDWTSVADVDHPVVATLRPTERGYAAIRVFLHLTMLDRVEETVAFRKLYDQDLARTYDGFPRTDAHGTVLGVMRDPGYQIITALGRCLVTKVPIRPSLFTVRPTTYYATALHLKTLQEVFARHPDCVPVPVVDPADLPYRWSGAQAAVVPA